MPCWGFKISVTFCPFSIFLGQCGVGFLLESAIKLSLLYLLYLELCVVIIVSQRMVRRTECMMTLVVYENICEMLLIFSGNVGLNPGPSKTCPKSA